MEINNSSVFVLPVLGKHYTFYGNNLEQCYLYNKLGLDNCICFLFSGAVSEDIDSEMRKLPCYVDTISKKGKFIYFYSIPDEYLSDIELFKVGKYSKMSDDYKQKILECNSNQSKNKKNTKLYGILYPDSTKGRDIKKDWEDKIGEKLPDDSEVWSISDEKNETLFI